jgi:O-antigen ligase
MQLRKYWNFDAAFTAGAIFILLVFVNLGQLRPVIGQFRPTLVVGLLAIILLLIRGLRGEGTVSLGAAGWCWAGLVLMAFFSAILAPPAPERWWWSKDTRDVAFWAAVGSVKFFGAYFITYNMITSVKTLRGVYWVFLLAVMGLVYFAIKVMIFSGGRLGLFVGPFYGVNETAMGMAMFLAFCLVLAVLPAKEFRWNRLFLVISVCCVLLIVRTFSRGGFLAMMAVLFMWLMREKRKVLACVVTIGLIGLMIALSGMVRLGDEAQSDTYADRIKLITKVTNAAQRDPNVQGRIDLAREAIQVWEKHPLLGIGVGCFGEHCQWPGYLAMRAARRDVNAAVHNSLLHVLVEQGLLGFIFYVPLLLITLRNILVARRRRTNDPFLNAVSDGMFIAFIGYFVASNTISEQYNWCFVILTGIAAGARKVVGHQVWRQTAAWQRTRSTETERMPSRAKVPVA